MNHLESLFRRALEAANLLEREGARFVRVYLCGLTVERDLANDSVLVAVQFNVGRAQCFRIDECDIWNDRYLRASLTALEEMRHHHPAVDALTSRVQENVMLDRERRAMGARMNELRRRPNTELQQARLWDEYLERDRHIRQHHAGVFQGRAVETVILDESSTIDHHAVRRAGPGEVVGPMPDHRFDAMRYAIEYGNAFMRPAIADLFGETETACDPEVEARAMELFLSRLSDLQRTQYKSKRYFYVRGSAGSKFKIMDGRQMNIYQLGTLNRVKQRWCFLPSGNLAKGDVMLAQKIALETDEKRALAVAVAVS